MIGIPGQITVADEWFDVFIQDLEADPQRVRRAISERYRPLPPSVLRQRVYDATTEQLLHKLKALAA